MLRAIRIIRELNDLRSLLAYPVAVDPRNRIDILEEIAELEARLALERERLPDDRRWSARGERPEPQAQR